MKNSPLLYLAAVALHLTIIPSSAQETVKSFELQSKSSKQLPERRKDISYFKDGRTSTISHYRRGHLVRYLDYFHDGQVFQDFKYEYEKYHGRYIMWNEVAEILIKGKMKHGNPYSGIFDRWDEEIKGYMILKYRKGEVVESNSLPVHIETTDK